MTREELLDLQWLQWAKELQAIAQDALAYETDKYDIERFRRVREIAAEIVAGHTQLSKEEVEDIFCCERGYQTPRVTTRSALFLEGKILLVRESGELWNLPGGWCDEDQTIRANGEKELWEETGIRGRVTRLVAVQDRNRHNFPASALNHANHLMLCEPVGEIGPFRPNLETQERGFFPLDQLPPLDTRRTTREQILLCWQAAQAEHWETLFD